MQAHQIETVINTRCSRAPSPQGSWHSKHIFKCRSNFYESSHKLSQRQSPAAAGTQRPQRASEPGRLPADGKAHLFLDEQRQILCEGHLFPARGFAERNAPGYRNIKGSGMFQAFWNLSWYRVLFHGFYRKHHLEKPAVCAQGGTQAAGFSLISAVCQAMTDAGVS